MDRSPGGGGTLPGLGRGDQRAVSGEERGRGGARRKGPPWLQEGCVCDKNMVVEKKERGRGTQVNEGRKGSGAGPRLS